jgi:hypothetical protein
MSKRAPSKKYTFTLKNLNIQHINEKYDIQIPSEEESILSEKPIDNTTKLTELNNNNKGTPELISFLDESKRAHTCHISMIDFESRMDVNKHVLLVALSNMFLVKLRSVIILILVEMSILLKKMLPVRRESIWIQIPMNNFQ